MTFRQLLPRIDWVNSSFLIVIALLALTASPYYIYHYGVDAFQIGMLLFYLIATGLSITLGYHRLFAHLSFTAKWPVKLFTLVFGACAFENSALKWCSDHRHHHKNTDHDHNDPYSISRGFFWAHMGWIMCKTKPEHPMNNVGDLQKDALVMWQHRWDKIIAVVVGFLLPSFLGYLWNGSVGAWGGLLIAGVLRVVLVQHSTFCINSLCHWTGARPYDSRVSARDSFWVSLVTFGEGYHNFHHVFQHDYRNGVKPWNFDPTKWSIWLLSKIGMTGNLRRESPEKIAAAEAREQARLQGNTPAV
jgi:stearoyl-CoA desaturase (Delta-9 desaturase)